jgi:hypothetical protein
MISEAVLIERGARLRRLEMAIEEVDVYLAERQEFHQELIFNLRSELESAFEFCSEDHRLLVEELRDLQTAIKLIGGVV